MKTAIGASALTIGFGIGFVAASTLFNYGLTAIYRNGGYVWYVDGKAVVVPGKGPQS